MRAALIKDGLVVNVIIAGETYKVPEGFILVESDTANIGDIFQGGIFLPPVITVEEPRLIEPAVDKLQRLKVALSVLIAEL